MEKTWIDDDARYITINLQILKVLSALKGYLALLK
jgi:hypothetical protein